MDLWRSEFALLLQIIISVLVLAKCDQAAIGGGQDYTNYRASSECGARPNFKNRRGNQTRISNGYLATREEFPSFASIKVETNSGLIQLCSGVIVGSRLVLTAAHCITDARVVLLSEDFSMEHPRLWRGTITAERFCQFSTYRSNIIAGDYGVIVLDSAIKFQGNIQPACLTNANITEGSRGVAVGIGGVKLDDDGIEESPRTNALPMEKVGCFGETINSHPTVSCYRAYHKDYQGSACLGDSGGPLYMMIKGKQTVVGLTSHGSHPCPSFPSTVGMADLTGERFSAIKQLAGICLHLKQRGLRKLDLQGRSFGPTKSRLKNRLSRIKESLD